MSQGEAMSISRVEPQDFDAFITLICALAEFEKLDPPDAAAIERLKTDAFSQSPRFQAFLARTSEEKAIGYCILFDTYSSFLAKPTLYLEDLFVLPAYRRNGVARSFMKHILELAIRGNYGRVEWQVLDWNTNAIDFYNKLSADHMKQWFPYRISCDKFSETISRL